MSIRVTGKTEKKGFGFGVWALVSEEGQAYELQNPPSELCQAHAKVTVEGSIQENVMTLAMIGPVLAVESYRIDD
ncbi:MAG: hypothetical protein VKJ02_04635 [Snowella sp.]|nr:hypothetical protein [Snowella sp.]